MELQYVFVLEPIFLSLVCVYVFVSQKKIGLSEWINLELQLTTNRTLNFRICWLMWLRMVNILCSLLTYATYHFSSIMHHCTSQKNFESNINALFWGGLETNFLKKIEFKKKKKKNLFIRLSKETYSERINRKGWKRWITQSSI